MTDVTPFVLPRGSSLWARSYTLRAVLAVTFLVAFYLVAIGLGAGLLALPVLEVLSVGRLHVKLAILCVSAGGVILWNILPRFERWEAPGQRIEPAEHPRLFGLIDEVSRTMGVAGPAEVYLVPDVNAFVTQRGGLLGFGGTRVMGLGVPLLAVQNVSQLKAVIAHELGHFAGGETKLSGLVYATRSAMLRTFQALSVRGSSLLNKPFEWMLKGYMRLTQAISRQQELLADAWAVRVGGYEAHTSALQSVELHAIGFDGFVREDVVPLAQEGLGPQNVYEGYRRFLGSTGWKRVLPKLEEQVAQREADPFDSHPSLAERLLWAQQVQAPPLPVDRVGAWELLEGGETLERAFTDLIRPQELKAVAWDDVAKAWERIIERGAHRVQARADWLNAGAVATVLASKDLRTRFACTLDPELVGNRAADLAQAQRRTVTAGLHTWLTTLLVQHGWALDVRPGERITLVKDGETVDTLEWMEKLYDNQLSLSELEARWTRSGIARDARVVVPDDVRAAAVAPRALVTLEPAKKHTVVQAPLTRMFFPVCCASCLGSADEMVTLTKPVKSFASDQQVHLNVFACHAHTKTVLNAFVVKAYEAKTDTVTLQVPDADYARLLVEVNR